jgi:hypothetical protein
MDDVDKRACSRPLTSNHIFKSVVMSIGAENSVQESARVTVMDVLNFELANLQFSHYFHKKEKRCYVFLK